MAIWDMMIAFSFMVMLAIAGFKAEMENIQKRKDIVVANYMQKFQSASEVFLRNIQFCTSAPAPCLTDGTASTAYNTFTIADLQGADFLVPTFAATNTYGQEPILIVRNNGPSATIEALIVARNGRNIPFKSLRTIVGQLGGEAGYYLNNNPTNVVFSSGASTVTTTWSAPALTPIPAGSSGLFGRLAINMSVESATVSMPYLHRSAVPGYPEATQMNDDIDMTGNDINNIGPDQDSVTAGVQGLSASEAVYVSFSTTIGTEIVKPVCKSGLTPNILVTPVQGEDIAEGQPISGIRAYADDLGSSWRTRLQVKTYKGWLNDLSSLGTVEVGGATGVIIKCTRP